jgi:uncharacterized membrane protein YfcA
VVLLAGGSRVAARLRATVLLAADRLIAGAASASLGSMVGVRTGFSVLLGVGVGGWRETLLVMAGAVIGGYAGGHLGRRLPGPVLRGLIVAITTGTTAAFFLRLM